MIDKELHAELEEIRDKLDNHITHISADISQIKTDIDWIKRFFWLIAGSTITAIVAAVLGLVFK